MVFRNVGLGGQLGGIQNQLGVFDEKDLVTLQCTVSKQKRKKNEKIRKKKSSQKWKLNVRSVVLIGLF